MNFAKPFSLALLVCGGAQMALGADAPATTPAAGSAAAAAAAPTPPAKYKNTYVIVHGAWGGGWAFKEVDELLTDKGNKVYRPTLTGQGEKVHLTSPDIALTTHIDDIANVILWEDLQDVVLVGHSYGGMVITGVADRIPDRIKKIVYLDAVLPEDGENLNLAMTGRTDTELVGRRPNAEGYFPAMGNNATKPIPHDVDMPAKPISDRIALKNQEAVKKIPTTYILTVDPGSEIWEDRFVRSYRRAEMRGWDTVVMEGDHNVQWSHPKELAALLENASAKLTPPDPSAQVHAAVETITVPIRTSVLGLLIGPNRVEAATQPEEIAEPLRQLFVRANALTPSAKLTYDGTGNITVTASIFELDRMRGMLRRYETAPATPARASPPTTTPAAPAASTPAAQ